MDRLVSTEWLAAEGGAEDLRILDATYHALEPERDAAAEYAREHIPGALHLDLAHLKDDADPLPGMLPPPRAFAQRIEALGVGRDSRVVLYDNSPHRTACRAWWMFRTFGLERVAVLDGGLPRWKADGRPLASGIETGSPSVFAAIKDEAAVRDLAQMTANLASGAEQVVDARSFARFTGEEEDPRGLAPGHIPGSVSLTYSRLFRPDGTFRPAEELRAEFASVGIDLSKAIVTTCGSGVTAAVVLFAAYLVGARRLALYDGSWSEWGALADTPKATGVPA